MRRGVVLIVVLAVLTLLSLLATSFATRQSVERRVAHNYLDLVQARFAAQSGIEFAIDRLWHQTRNGWTPNEPDTPVIVDGDVTSKTGGVGDAIYSVRVLDCQGQINVNDGGELDSPASQNLRRILNILGRELCLPFLGDRILARRPPGGYGSIYDLPEYSRIRAHVTVHSWTNSQVHQPVALSERRGHGKDRLNRLVDQPLRFFDPAFPETEYRFPWYCAVWSLDSLTPKRIERASRSPVNVNSASREVLIALLDGLEGFFLLDRRRPVPADMFYQFLSHSYGYGPELSRRTSSWARKGSELGYLYRTGAIDPHKIADEIIARRPFRNWQEFNGFADGLVKRGVLSDDRPIFFEYQRARDGTICRTYSADQAKIASQAMADVLKANFNPNLHLNELNPDAALATLVDKTDLLVHSTEFCFVPMGTFEIRSEGMKLHEARCVARSFHQAVVKLYEPKWRDEFIHLPKVEGSISGDGSRNFPDPGERLPGPYPSDYRWDGLYAELHAAVGIPIPEFRRRATFSFWIKPSWDPKSTGKIRTFLTLDDMILTGPRDPKGPLPFGLFFLPSWHGGSEPTGRYPSPAPRSSLLWAVGVRGRGGHAVSIPASIEASRWSHIIVSCEASGELSLTVNGVKHTTNVIVHVPQLPRDWRGQYGPVVRLGGEFSDLALNPQYPRNYFADATIDGFHAWFDDPRGEASALRQYQRGRFQRASVYKTEWKESEIIAVSWTAMSNRVRARVFLDGEELMDPRWSPAPSSGSTLILRLDDTGQGPLVETAYLDDVTVFVSEGRSKYVSYCAVDVP